MNPIDTFISSEEEEALSKEGLSPSKEEDEAEAEFGSVFIFVLMTQ